MFKCGYALCFFLYKLKIDCITQNLYYDEKIVSFYILCSTINFIY